jgi:lanosterol synthase
MQRNNVCKVDLYVAHTPLLDVLNLVLSSYESCALPPARRRALDLVYRMVCEEDENTCYQTLGPVNK